MVINSTRIYFNRRSLTFSALGSYDLASHPFPW